MENDRWQHAGSKRIEGRRDDAPAFKVFRCYLNVSLPSFALYVVLSLPIFRLVRSRSLSLGAWVPKNLARRRKPSAARCLLDLLGPPGRRSGCWPHLSGTGSASPRPDRNSWRW
jgi:hypothetical protein